MKAILMTSVGEPNVLELREISEPKIQHETEILVRLKAAGVNPIDTKLRRLGTYYPDRMPAILGCDGAGVVESVGERVNRFKVGDEVYFCNGGIGGLSGNYSEFTVVDERFAALKPTSLTFTEAAGAPLVLITVWESLFDRCEIKDGERVLIHGGAGGIGHIAVQMAKLKGARVCTTVGSEKRANFAEKLGAERVILHKEQDFVQEILKWSDGLGVNLALDTVGGKTFYRTFSAVCFYGNVVTLLEPDSEHANWKEARLRNLGITYEWMLAPMLFGLMKEREHQAEILKKCARLIDEGKLSIFVDKTFPLKDTANAHQFLEKGSVTGKIVLVIEE